MTPDDSPVQLALVSLVQTEQVSDRDGLPASGWYDIRCQAVGIEADLIRLRRSNQACI